MSPIVANSHRVQDAIVQQLQAGPVPPKELRYRLRKVATAREVSNAVSQLRQRGIVKPGRSGNWTYDAPPPVELEGR